MKYSGGLVRDESRGQVVLYGYRLSSQTSSRSELGNIAAPFISKTERGVGGLPRNRIGERRTYYFGGLVC